MTIKGRRPGKTTWRAVGCRPLRYGISQRWSRGHKARGQGQGHKKKSEAKAKNSLSEDRHSRGQGQECSRPRPRTQAQVLSKKKKKKRSSQKFFRRSPLKKKSSQKFFRRSPLKKKSSQKFFKRSPRKHVFQKNFQALYKILTIQKLVLSSSRGQANFRGLEASRPRPRTSKSALEAKDVLEDSTSGIGIWTWYGIGIWT